MSEENVLKKPKLSQSSFVNDYNGWTGSIDRVDIDTLTPETFEQNYVCARRPVIIRGCLRDDTFRKDKIIDLKHLREIAGKEIVRIEHRSDLQHSFGVGNEQMMPLTEFLDKIESNESGNLFDKHKAT